MNSRIAAYIFCIVGGIIAVFVEYYYRKSIKEDKNEESVARNIISYGAYLFIVFSIYAAIMLIIEILN